MNNLIIRADRKVSPFLMPFSPQRFTHCRAGVCFRYGIEVAVDIGGCAHIAMSKPLLNLLHRHALGEHKLPTYEGVFILFQKISKKYPTKDRKIFSKNQLKSVAKTCATLSFLHIHINKALY